MGRHCAYCQGELDPDRFGAELFSIQFSRAEAALIRVLASAKGSVVPTDRLVSSLGSTTAGLAPLINGVRTKLARSGYSIRNDRGVGYSLHRVRHPANDVTAAYRILRIR